MKHLESAETSPSSFASQHCSNRGCPCSPGWHSWLQPTHPGMAQLDPTHTSQDGTTGSLPTYPRMAQLNPSPHPGMAQLAPTSPRILVRHSCSLNVIFGTSAFGNDLAKPRVSHSEEPSWGPRVQSSPAHSSYTQHRIPELGRSTRVMESSSCGQGVLQLLWDPEAMALVPHPGLSCSHSGLVPVQGEGPGLTCPCRLLFGDSPAAHGEVHPSLVDPWVWSCPWKAATLPWRWIIPGCSHPPLG